MSSFESDNPVGPDYRQPGWNYAYEQSPFPSGGYYTTNGMKMVVCSLAESLCPSCLGGSSFSTTKAQRTQRFHKAKRPIGPRWQYIPMLRLIAHPTQFPVPKNQNLIIEEFIGVISTGTPTISIARLCSGEGWSEPAQQPDFDEYTLVLHGELHVENVEEKRTTIVRANQAVIVPKGVKVRYRTPSSEGADYIAICLPAFTMDAAHREEAGQA